MYNLNVIVYIAPLLLFITACAQSSFQRHGRSLVLPEFNNSNSHNEYKKNQYGFYLQWPVEQIRLSQNFRPRKNPHHEGIDLVGRLNSPIFSAHEGLVIYSGSGYRGYGNMVIVKYDDEWATLYAHLNKIQVSEGDVLAAGDLIGNMGKTGRATGVHLHFEVLRNRLPVNPIAYLPKSTNLATK